MGRGFHGYVSHNQRVAHVPQDYDIATPPTARQQEFCGPSLLMKSGSYNERSILVPVSMFGVPHVQSHRLIHISFLFGSC